MAPTAAMDAGHRSPSSKTKGTPRDAPTAQPATAAKNCGEVATTTSGRRSNSPAANPETMKLRKSNVRSRTPLLALMNVFTRTTRIPSMASTWCQRLR